MRATYLAAVLAAFTWAMGSSNALADSGHADILVSQIGGKLVTGTFDPGPPPDADGGVRVFGAEFSHDFAATAPGFYAITQSLPDGYQALPGSQPLTFNILAQPIGAQAHNLWYWDGEGEVSWGAAPNGEQLWVYKSTGPITFLAAIADGGSANVPGYLIDNTDSAGGIHKHLDYFLTNSSSTLSPAPAAGVYLLTLGLSMPGLQDADPVWIVFGAGLHDEEAHELAVDWVQANLVPEPGSLGLLSVGLLALLRRRR